MERRAMNIFAAIVTHNRLALLKECIESLRRQTVPLAGIVVINNGSTDGSREWLEQQPGLTCVHQENLGGSYGFAESILQSWKRQADWIWVMDDDSIPHPTALEALVQVIKSGMVYEPIGFLCSRVEWADGNPHRMNIPHISIFNKHGQPFSQYDKIGAFHVSACSFVSILVSAKAVQELGLPIRDFYIWGDDMEFTQRITRSGLLGLYVPASIVLHKTKTNYSSDIFHDDNQSIWKYRYGIRNHLFIIRQQKGFGKYFGKLLKHFFVLPVKLMKKRKDHRWLFIKTVWGAAWRSIGFTPNIEKPHA